MTLYSTRDSNIRKTWVIFTLFLIVIIGVGWAFSYIYNDVSILYFAVLFSVLMNVIAYWNSDKIAMAIAGAHPATHENARELFHIIENLSIIAGIQAPKIYIIDDPSPNAFATGRNPKHAAVAVTTGLLERLDRSELEGVIAHELSHVKNYDTLLQTIVVVLVGFVAIISDIFTRSLWWGRRSSNDNRGNAVLMLVGVVLAILAPIVATMIQLAISRKREFLADASGGLLTRYPEGLASALEKIAAAPPLRRATNATAHLYIANPFKIDAPSAGGIRKTPWLAKLFMTHPPIEERVKALRGIE